MSRAIVRSRRRVRGSMRHRWLRFETLEDRRLLAAELGLDEPAAGAPPKSLAELPAAAQYAVSAAIGRDQDAYHASVDAAGWTLANSAQGFTAQLQSGGLLISSGADRWQMSLAGFGYGGTTQMVTAAECSASGNRVACDYGAIEEWYVNGPGGLQQGFTVDPLPQGDAGDDAEFPSGGRGPQGAAASLTVELGLGGDLMATVNAVGNGLTLARPDGSTALSYTGLVAYDATGRTLPASLEVRPDGARQELLIHVDAAGAQGAGRHDYRLRDSPGRGAGAARRRDAYRPVRA